MGYVGWCGRESEGHFVTGGGRDSILSRCIKV